MKTRTYWDIFTEVMKSSKELGLKNMREVREYTIKIFRTEKK